MKAKDVFTPGRFPTYTYVDDHLIERGQQLSDALDDGSMLVSISGPSKSGKTVFVEHLLGKENLIQITGAGIRATDELWVRVFDIIGTPITHATMSGGTVSGTVGLKGSAEANIMVAKGKGEISGSGTFSSQSSSTEGAATDFLQLLIKEYLALILWCLLMIFTTYIEIYRLNWLSK